MAVRQGVRSGRADRLLRIAGSGVELPANYKWTALFISTLGMLMATIDGSIVLIALPDIFRGIGLNPLQPGNTFYLLWMILGFLVVTSVLVVTLGRMGDIYGRVRTYNLGFAVFTFFSLLLSITWMTGHAAGVWLITMRIFQGVGAAMLMANSSAILTDAFPDGPAGHGPRRQPGGGVQRHVHRTGARAACWPRSTGASSSWSRCPIGLFATVFGYLKLRELGPGAPARIDWPGNITFALGLILVMIGITYGIEPYGTTMSWAGPARPVVLGALGPRRGPAGRLLRHRDQGRPADVPAAALQDPGLHQRRVRQLPGRAEPRWADVHARSSGSRGSGFPCTAMTSA
jgi:MFS family permease